MATLTYGGSGSSSGALDVRSSHIFATTTARNTYFTSNPSEVVEDMYISVSGVLQKRQAGAWVDVSAVIKGQTGTNAPAMLINYSADGLTGWTPTLNNLTHKYWRWSTDNGVSWLPVPPAVALFKLEDTGSAVPPPYEYVVNGNGELELQKGGTPIMTVDEDSLWVREGLNTGDGEINIGEMHYVGSAGDMIAIKNNSSNMIAVPAFSSISPDGTTIVESTARVHVSGIQTLFPAGGVGIGQVDYNSTFVPTVNSAFVYVRIIPDETYVGDLTLTVRNVSSGKKVSQFTFAASTFTGTPFQIPFKHPLWLRAGQTYSTAITKINGSYLSARSNVAGDQPYRESSFLEYSDQPIFHAGNAAAQATALSALTGSNRVAASAIRDFPVMTNSVYGMAKLGTTMSINGSGELNTTISPTGIKIVADEAARLAIPLSTGVTLAVQQDTGITWGIEASLDPSVALNWKQIGTVATSVVSFNGRTGGVTPATGDYNQKQIKTIHDDTLVEGWFGWDNNGLYFESP